jgi:hypothetical protein
VNIYYTDKKNITALELWPSIQGRTYQICFLYTEEDNMEEITEEEFELHLNAAKKLIWSL